MWKRRRGDRSQERSKSGQPIWRHEASKDQIFRPSTDGEPGVREAIEAHLDTHLGPCASVWHEVISELVHIDVYMWQPTLERPMFTFVTVGMSDMPMAVPDDAVAAGVARRAEVMLCLSPDWPVPSGPASLAPWDNPDAYFPIRWLKQLARLPHEYKTWLGLGHSVPNDDPAEPLASITKLCGWVLLAPMTLSSELARTRHRITL